MSFVILKKVFTWFKHYWYVPLFLIVIGIIYAITRKVISPDLLKVTKDSYDKQIKVIEEIEKEKTQKYKKATKKYVELVKKLDDERRISEFGLAVKKKEQIIKLMQNFTEEELAEKLAKQLGIKYTKQRKED